MNPYSNNQRFSLIPFGLLAVLFCHGLAGQDRPNSDSFPASRQDLQQYVDEPSQRPHGNDVPFWNEDANAFFASKPVLRTAAAITNRDSQQVAESTKDIVDIDAPGRAGVTLLYWAYLQGNLEAFKFLLSQGASPDVAPTEELPIDPRLDAGRTLEIRLLAHAGGHTSERPGFFEAALKSTKLPNQLDEFGATILHNWARLPPFPNHLDVLKKIIDLGVDINAKDEIGFTALQRAVPINPKAMLILLDAGANPTPPLPDGRSLIEFVRQCADLQRDHTDYSEVIQRLDPPALSSIFTHSAQQRLELTPDQQTAVKRLQSEIDQRLQKILSADQLKQLRAMQP